MKKKIYVVFKEKRYEDYHCNYSDIQILAVCDDPKKALQLLENELKYCHKKQIVKNECLLFVKIFENLNEMEKQNNKIFDIFKFKKMVKALL